MKGNGYLAIWSDLAPEDETDWAHWITREHAAERVGIAGFLACRIFRAIGTAAGWRASRWHRCQMQRSAPTSPMNSCHPGKTERNRPLLD